jgi:4-phytase/acid phosphatase
MSRNRRTSRSGLSCKEIHTLDFAETQRSRYPAQIQGSNLANYILQRMEQSVNVGNAAVAREKRLIILAGHDTNVANVAAMLDLSWNLPDLPRNDTPPAGAIVFELFGGTTLDSYFVVTRYIHQTVEQMRKQSVLSLKNPPDWVDLPIPKCAAASRAGNGCPFPEFQKIVQQAIDPNFVSKGSIAQ